MIITANRATRNSCVDDQSFVARESHDGVWRKNLVIFAVSATMFRGVRSSRSREFLQEGFSAVIQRTWDRIAATMKNLSTTQKLARAARAVPLNPTWFEPMEPRRLMAVSFNVDINDPGGTYQDFYDPITRTIEAAGDDWGEN